jgi:hypothetical protein
MYQNISFSKSKILFKQIFPLNENICLLIYRLVFIVNPDDGGDECLRNVCKLLPDYMASYYSSYISSVRFRSHNSVLQTKFGV